MTTFAERSQERDNKIRERVGWPPGAFIAPKFDLVKDEHEKWAVALIGVVCHNILSLGVYSLVDMLANIRRANIHHKENWKALRVWVSIHSFPINTNAIIEKMNELEDR